LTGRATVVVTVATWMGSSAVEALREDFTKTV
jgi:hypothetical protein